MLREDDHAPAPPTEDSERSRLDPFVVATGDAPPRDQRDLMERPFFSLAKTPRTKPILYKAADIEVQVFGMIAARTTDINSDSSSRPRTARSWRTSRPTPAIS